MRSACRLRHGIWSLFQQIFLDSDLKRILSYAGQITVIRHTDIRLPPRYQRVYHIFCKSGRVYQKKSKLGKVNILTIEDIADIVLKN